MSKFDDDDIVVVAVDGDEKEGLLALASSHDDRSVLLVLLTVAPVSRDEEAKASDNCKLVMFHDVHTTTSARKTWRWLRRHSFFMVHVFVVILHSSRRGRDAGGDSTYYGGITTTIFRSST
mmetsp:Transcript_19070/g.35615  ORF Transcript_19070/g.35615 Transcript_19070/m.35615 type:complete len:121 (+) Transcript_19070:4127-4489(+)